MPDLSVILRVQGRRCVVVGGGPVARRRTESLLQADALITVIAPQVEQRLECLSVQIERRPYREGDLEGAILAVVATDDPAVNEKVADDAATTADEGTPLPNPFAPAVRATA